MSDEQTVRPPREPRVLVVGDVIDDLVVRPHRPIRPATDTPATITPSPGGSGANAAVWLARAGVRVRFVGRVGAADLARHAGLLRAAGVEPVLVPDARRPTGSIVVLLDPDGERTMLTDRGANLGLRAADLPDRLLDDVDALHVSGYSLFDPGVRDAVLDLGWRAREQGLRISVDPGSVGFLSEVGPGRFLSWIAGADLLRPNLAEAELLAAGAGSSTGALEALLDHVPLVAVTRGPDGASVLDRDQPTVTVPALPVEVVDTTGAGDAFTGGFLAAWLAGADPVRALQAGVASAAEAITQAGARPPRSR